MPEFVERLQKSLGDAFHIEQELGGGGMSRVFLVTEKALNRRIVLKVMSPELAAGLSAERFQREVMLAASLQQANIVPLLTTGGADGLPWYTMPFVRGKSLRERLQADDPMPLPEAISVLKDIARALAFAHDEGVVHRDIKPENVLLSGGTAVVSDFGIAKAMDIARTAGGASLTHTGASLGTPAYMAPEQVAGDPVDQRTDLYAWGLIAYEVLAGAHPFAGRANVQSVMAAQIAEKPPSLHSVRPEISPALAALVDQCLAKDADARPRSAGEILRVLDELSLSPTPGEPSAPARLRRAVRPLGVAAVAGMVIVGLALALARFRAPASSVTGAETAADSVRSIAVLPFLNVGGDSTQEYLADGMTDELATALGRMRGLRVTARSSAYRYKNRRDVDVRLVGQELGARYLLLGTVRRLGNQLRVSAQLANTSDGTELWARNFDRPAGDVLQVQDSLTNAIATALEQRFSEVGAPLPGAPAVGRAQGTTNAAAYDLYLQGNYLLAQRRPGLEGAASAFERAIAIDSGFARAYAGLANVVALYFYFGSSPMRPRVDSVTFVAGRALALDSTLAEAHVALGIARMSQAMWSAAGADLRHALALEPGYATAHFQLARLYMYRGQVDKGREELELAKRLDPYTPLYSAWLAFALAAEGGDAARALSEAQRSMELDSLSLVVTNFWPLTNLMLGRPDAARAVARRLVRVPFNEGTIAFILGSTGARDEARAIAQTIRARRASWWQDERNLSFALLALGDTAQALDAMERSRARAEPIASFFPLWSPIFDSVRGSVRFTKFAESVGLDGAAIRR